MWCITKIRWRHQMETFSALLAFCAGNSPVTGEFPSQRPITRSFHVFFDLRLNQQMSKQWRRRWFETPSRSLWRHCNDMTLVTTRSWWPQCSVNTLIPEQNVRQSADDILKCTELFVLGFRFHRRLFWDPIGKTSALVQVMAWCLMAPSHYMDQCWLIVNWTYRSGI